jgi:hypothetical protein
MNVVYFIARDLSTLGVYCRVVWSFCFPHYRLLKSMIQCHHCQHFLPSLHHQRLWKRLLHPFLFAVMPLKSNKVMQCSCVTYPPPPEDPPNTEYTVGLFIRDMRSTRSLFSPPKARHVLSLVCFIRSLHFSNTFLNPVVVLTNSSLSHPTRLPAFNPASLFFPDNLSAVRARRRHSPIKN